MANPVGINSYVTNFFSPSNLHLGVTHSVNNIGGYQEFATIAERNAIPVQPNSATSQPYNGFTLNDDKWSSGRRRVGMMAYVVENQKLYTLQPVGYFGNGGELNETHWDAAPEWERAVRIDPSGVFSSEANSLANNFNNPLVTSGASDLGIDVNDPNGCWVELVMGIDGNPISAVAHDANTGDLTITLTHDGSGSGTPIEFTTTLPTGYVSITNVEIVAGNQVITLSDGTVYTTPIGRPILNFVAGSGFYAVNDNGNYEGNNTANNNPLLHVQRGVTYIVKRTGAGIDHPLYFSTTQLDQADALSAGILGGKLAA